MSTGKGTFMLPRLSSDFLPFPHLFHNGFHNTFQTMSSVAGQCSLSLR